LWRSVHLVERGQAFLAVFQKSHNAEKRNPHVVNLSEGRDRGDLLAPFGSDDRQAALDHQDRRPIAVRKIAWCSCTAQR
jgi:hypothetical protein